ncbi:hypothetical protein FGRMN_6206 [Fusarium graminum]|nr:hypothetical protein FGRMN_6206 [Fusarium graminum]
MSVKHHLRFSIEYLRRQNLPSATGLLVNFTGLLGYLYFTENAVFTLHSLIRGGYFHELCKDIDNARERVLPDILSPFATLSGFTDDFESIKDLCSGARDGVFLEESAIPHIHIWPHDADTEFNAYLYDFLKHGSLNLLVQNDGIRQGDVWFHLKDLKPILTSLKGVVIAEGDYDIGALGEDKVQSGTEEQNGKAETQKPVKAVGKTAKPSAKGKGKGKGKLKIADSWDDDSEESDSDSETIDPTTANVLGRTVIRRGVDVGTKAFSLLGEESGDKFYKIGA